MQQLVHRLWHRQRRYRRDSGFTIVELLVVLIVMAILAVIVITTYNNVQERASNTKTVAAVEAWTKAILLYHADKGKWPSQYSCLGDLDTYDGTACQNIGSPSMSAAFLSAVTPYLGNGSIPEPDARLIGDPDGAWKKGAAYNQSSRRVYFALQGADTCPEVTGLVDVTRSSNLAGGVWCFGWLE